MRLKIEIRDEIAKDFQRDKFNEFFERVIADMNCLCGNYEKEIAIELKKAFGKSEVVEIIEQQPTVEQDWIPCRKRLPSEECVCHVTYEYPSGRKIVEKAKFEKKNGMFRFVVCGGGVFGKHRITAWQPLNIPKPYQPKEVQE